MITTIPQEYDVYDNTIKIGALTGFSSRRRFTDLFCCLSYLILISTCIGIVTLHKDKGILSFEKLRDSSHHPCDGSHKFLYFPTSSLDKSICIKSCPDRAGLQLQCKTNNQFTECPLSISGLISNHELNICHHPETRIPLTTIGRVLNNSVFSAKQSIIRTLIITSAIAFIIVLSVLIFPSLVYFYFVVFEFIMIAVTAGCFYRYFIGRLPFVDILPLPGFKGSYYALGLGIFFLISSIISITMLVTRFPTVQFTIKMIRVAQQVLMSNPLILVNSMILTILSIGAFILNIWLYKHLQSFGEIDHHSKGLDQYKVGLTVYLLRVLFLIQVLWTHGFIISLSHFIFESKATLWYYSQLLGVDTCYSFATTIQLVTWHFGTICYGSLYTYHSQTITNALTFSQYKTPPVEFNTACCLHNSCFKYLSVYGFIPTILEGLPFMTSNNRFSVYKRVAEQTYPQLYMQGSYFTNSAKFFLTVLSTLLVYIQLVHYHPDLYFHFRALIVPLIITAFIAHEIATAWLDITGTIGDTVMFNKVIDTSAGSPYTRGNPLASMILDQKVQLPIMTVY